MEQGLRVQDLSPNPIAKKATYSSLEMYVASNPCWNLNTSCDLQFSAFVDHASFGALPISLDLCSYLLLDFVRQ